MSRARPTRPCPACGYPLVEPTPSPRCPECGAVIPSEGTNLAPAAGLPPRALDRMRWGIALLLWWMLIVLPIWTVSAGFELPRLERAMATLQGALQAAGIILLMEPTFVRTLEDHQRPAARTRRRLVQGLALGWIIVVVPRWLPGPDGVLELLMPLGQVAGFAALLLLVAETVTMSRAAGVPGGARRMPLAGLLGLVGAAATGGLFAVMAQPVPPLVLGIPLLLLGPGSLLVALILLATTLIGLFQALTDARQQRPPSRRLEPAGRRPADDDAAPRLV